MPTGIKLISILNILLSLVFTFNQFFMEKVALSYPFASYINLISASALILITLIILLRLAPFVGFVRAIIYVIALVLGLQILLTIKYLFSVYGILTIAVDALVIFYLIGVRGYLASERAARYFTHQD
jgi:hypothetical protein